MMCSKSGPLFYPAVSPVHWLMVAPMAAEIHVAALALPGSGAAVQCQPIGCYAAAKHLADRCPEHRRA